MPHLDRLPPTPQQRSSISVALAQLKGLVAPLVANAENTKMIVTGLANPFIFLSSAATNNN
jgi:hypothetical protein